MDFRIRNITEKIMLFGPFGRELLCFEYLDISLDWTIVYDLTGISVVTITGNE